MTVLAISGSPRRNGNTDTLLHLALDEIARHGIDVEFETLAGRTIKTCTACMGCVGTNRCVLEDDFDPLFRRMLGADGIIVGSPVYFGSATGEITAFLDRAGYVARKNGNLFARKVGGPIAVARRIGQNFTLAQLLMWFMINGFVVPGSSYWTIAFGANPGDVLEDAEGVETIRTFAENIAWLLGKLRG